MLVFEGLGVLGKFRGSEELVTFSCLVMRGMLGELGAYVESRGVGGVKSAGDVKRAGCQEYCGRGLGEGAMKGWQAASTHGFLIHEEGAR